MLPKKPNFGMFITDHRSSSYINFAVYRRYSFFYTGYTKYYTMWPIDLKYLKCILVLLNCLMYAFGKVGGVTPDFFFFLVCV